MAQSHEVSPGSAPRRCRSGGATSPAPQVGPLDLRGRRDGRRDAAGHSHVLALRHPRGHVDDSWRSCRRRRAPRPRPALGGTIYVAGGTTSRGNTAAVWAWDGDALAGEGAAAAGRSSTTPRSSSAGSSTSSAATRPGRSGARSSSTTAPRISWSPATRLPRANHAFGAVAFRGELWVIGGRRGETIAARGLDLVAENRPLARRPDDAEADGAARRRRRGRRDPRRLGVDLPGLGCVRAPLARRAGASV